MQITSVNDMQRMRQALVALHDDCIAKTLDDEALYRTLSAVAHAPPMGCHATRIFISSVQKKLELEPAAVGYLIATRYVLSFNTAPMCCS